MIVPGSVRPARAAEPSLLVIGAAPEITSRFARARVERVARPSAARREAIAVVFDLRTTDPTRLGELRADPRFAAAPLLLLVSEEPPDAILVLFDAMDCVNPEATGGLDRLRRRMRTLVEMGEHRRAAAERLMPPATTDDGGASGHAVLDEVDLGVVTADRDGFVTFINRTGGLLLDVEPELVGQHIGDLLALARPLTSVLGDGGRRSISHDMIRPDGVALDLELTVGRMQEGDANSYYLIFRDVGEDKLRAAERTRFERLAAMGTMVAGFAHEVRNPVAAVRSLAEELEEELRDAGRSSPHVSMMLEMVARIERLVRTALQFGRPATPRRGEHAPWRIVSDALTELHGRLRALGGDIRIEVEEKLPMVRVDDKQIAQALVILLNNALDAVQSTSRVSVRVRTARSLDVTEPRVRKTEPPFAPVVRFEVFDDGPGIPGEIVGRIFDPFFTTKPAGTGLGLSIAQQIVSENGGRLEVTSGPGATAFTIVCPASPM